MVRSIAHRRGVSWLEESWSEIELWSVISRSAVEGTHGYDLEWLKWLYGQRRYDRGSIK
ncbi:hypothetical protein YC2023_115978 [Brassica napus]